MKSLFYPKESPQPHYTQVRFSSSVLKKNVNTSECSVLNSKKTLREHSGLRKDKAFVPTQMASTNCLPVCHFPINPSNSAVTSRDQ